MREAQVNTRAAFFRQHDQGTFGRVADQVSAVEASVGAQGPFLFRYRPRQENQLLDRALRQNYVQYYLIRELH